VYFVHTIDRVMAEAYVHQKLAAHRTSGEFFEVAVGRAVEAMDEAAARYPIPRGLVSPKRRGGWGTDMLPQVFEHAIVSCPHCGKRNRIHSLAVSFRPKCGGCGKTLTAGS